MRRGLAAAAAVLFLTALADATPNVGEFAANLAGLRNNDLHIIAGGAGGSSSIEPILTNLSSFHSLTSEFHATVRKSHCSSRASWLGCMCQKLLWFHKNDSLS